MSSSEYALAKKVVQYLAANMQRPPIRIPFLSDRDIAFMSDPYGLLDLVRTETGVSPEVIDAWMVEAQPNGA